MVQPPRKTAWQFLTKLKILLAHEAGILLLAIYPKDLNICTYADVENSFIHNCQNLEATKRSFSR